MLRQGGINGALLTLSPTAIHVGCLGHLATMTSITKTTSHSPSDLQHDLFGLQPESTWPEFERFPYNHRDKRVHNAVWNDLLDSKAPLLITSYASLDRVIDFLAACRNRQFGGHNEITSIRVLLGHEPTESRRTAFSMQSHDLSEEVTRYWLERGVSIHLCAAILGVLELLESDLIAIRTSDRTPVHAKIYRGDKAVTVGSSNLSQAGMTWQIEGNCRFTRESDSDRYEEACTLAEAVWELGRDYKADFRRLLEQLLRAVTWQEALARASAELLEGDWAKRYLDSHGLGEPQPLWPVQEAGIAQAMWVLENVGSVLVADATGSGKTRLGAHLIRGLQVRNWRTGRVRHDIPVLVCPPHVAQNWEKETTQCGQAVKTYSHGLLSVKRSGLHEDTTDAIRRAQILAVDEAHNFLNRTSSRTRALYANMADHVLLFTATPINRGPQDLLPIIDLLGGDNFDDKILDRVEKVWRRWRRGAQERLSDSERAEISRAIQQFTVRRTKRMLNEAVDREPDRYRNRSGNHCRYPEHIPRTYNCDGTELDREVAREIRDLAARLKGITYFQKALRFPEHLRGDGRNDEWFLNMRLRAARALTAYHIAETLRSSRAALLEHIYGTRKAREICGIEEEVKSSPTGNAIDKIREIRGRPPNNELDAQLPPWLATPEEHTRACDEEIAIYEEIGRLAREISSAREEVKARLLTSLLDHHRLVLAFDSHLITLSDIRQRLERTGRGEILLATGQSRSMRERVNKAFDLASTEKDIIALCSDALSEGVNLQGASVVVLLDMPSVIRIAEQRIGRIDRMDSRHQAVEIYWPQDSKEFALRSDEVFLDRHRDVEDLIGSNITLPDSMLSGHDQNGSTIVNVRDYATEVERLSSGESTLDVIHDAFDPVRALVSGDDPLVPPEIYEKIRPTSARVLSSVSAVNAPDDWSFYAIGGTERGAPRWIYFDVTTSDPLTDLEAISAKLREKLSGEVEHRSIDEEVSQRISNDIENIEKWVIKFLPRKKQRALSEMERVLKKWAKDASASKDLQRLTLIKQILNILSPGSPDRSIDYGAIADWWIDMIRPAWYKHLTDRRRTRPALLKDIRSTLAKNPISTDQLGRTILELPLYTRPVGERVVAAIIGVKD